MGRQQAGGVRTEAVCQEGGDGGGIRLGAAGHADDQVAVGPADAGLHHAAAVVPGQALLAADAAGEHGFQVFFGQFGGLAHLGTGFQALAHALDGDAQEQVAARLAPAGRHHAALVQVHGDATHHHAAVGIGGSAFGDAVGVGGQEEARDEIVRGPGSGVRSPAGAQEPEQVVTDFGDFAGGVGLDAIAAQARVEALLFGAAQQGQALDGVGHLDPGPRTPDPGRARLQVALPRDGRQGRPQVRHPGGLGVVQQAPQARMDRQARQARAQGREGAVGRGRGAEEGEQILGGLQALRVRGLEPREGAGVRVAPGLEGQEGARQVDAGDFRVLVLVAAGVHQGRGEADAAARGRAARAARALGQAGAGHGLQAQFIQARGGVEAVHPSRARVDDRAHAGDGHGGFGHVGGQHHLAARRGRQGPVLLLWRQAAVQGQHVAIQAQVLYRALAPADLAHARQEHEDVAGIVEGGGLGHGLGDGLLQPRVGQEGCVAGGDGEGPARGVQDRRVAQEGGYARGIEGCRHDHQGQVRPQGLLQFPQVAHGQVRVQAALVELVENHGPDALQIGVIRQLARQAALGHDPQARVLAADLLEAHAVADLLAEGPAVLLGNAAGQGLGGDAAGLEEVDLPRHRPQEGRRHPRRLAGTRRCRHHRRLGPLHSRDDRGKDGVDGEGEHGGAG